MGAFSKPRIKAHIRHNSKGASDFALEKFIGTCVRLKPVLANKLLERPSLPLMALVQALSTVGQPSMPAWSFAGLDQRQVASLGAEKKQQHLEEAEH
jgi:hypothetical protein